MHTDRRLRFVGEARRALNNGGLIAGYGIPMPDLLEEIELILPMFDPDDIELTGNVLLGNGQFYTFGRWQPDTLSHVLEICRRYDYDELSNTVCMLFYVQLSPVNPAAVLAAAAVPSADLVEQMDNVGGAGFSLMLLTQPYKDDAMFIPSFGNCFLKSLRYLGYKLRSQAKDGPGVTTTRQQNMTVCKELGILVTVFSLSGLDILGDPLEATRSVDMLACCIKRGFYHVGVLKDGSSVCLEEDVHESSRRHSKCSQTKLFEIESVRFHDSSNEPLVFGRNRLEVHAHVRQTVLRGQERRHTGDDRFERRRIQTDRSRGNGGVASPDTREKLAHAMF